MRQPKAPAAARVQAAVALLDRGWGKPKQIVSGSDRFSRLSRSVGPRDGRNHPMKGRLHLVRPSN